MLTLGEASKQSTLSKTALRRAIASGHLRATRIDGWIYQIREDDLDRYASRLQVRTLARELGRSEDRLPFAHLDEFPAARPSLWRRTLDAIHRRIQSLRPARGLATPS
ncbi:MAG: excisionase family DNA-binding protein [Bauldia sp.]